MFKKEKLHNISTRRQLDIFDKIVQWILLYGRTSEDFQKLQLWKRFISNFVHFYFINRALQNCTQQISLRRSCKKNLYFVQWNETDKYIISGM